MAGHIVDGLYAGVFALVVDLRWAVFEFQLLGAILLTDLTSLILRHFFLSGNVNQQSTRVIANRVSRIYPLELNFALDDEYDEWNDPLSRFMERFVKHRESKYVERYYIKFLQTFSGQPMALWSSGYDTGL